MLKALEEKPQVNKVVVNGFEEVGGMAYENDSVIHPNFINSDYRELAPGIKIFQKKNGDVIEYKGERCFPIFIGEAAYLPNNHAFTKTIKTSKTFSFRKQ